MCSSCMAYPWTWFAAIFWRSFCSQLGASFFHSLSSGFHPETNGQTEHTNQTLENTLRCLAVANPTLWSRFLAWAEYAHNTLRNASRGLSPFEAEMGYQPPLFPELEDNIGVPSGGHFIQRCRSTQKRVCYSLLRASTTQKRFANRYRWALPTYCVDSSILVSSDHITFSQASFGSSRCSLANVRQVPSSAEEPCAHSRILILHIVVCY